MRCKTWNSTRAKICTPFPPLSAGAARSLGVSAALFFLAGKLFGLGAAYFACASAIAALYAFGVLAVLFGGNAFVNAVFFYINVASAWLGFFGVACELQL